MELPGLQIKIKIKINLDFRVKIYNAYIFRKVAVNFEFILMFLQ